MRLIGALLLVWFVVSFGCGVIFVEELNAIRVGGFKLGFWFAQQGSIYVFLVLIFVYAVMIGRIDKKYGVDETDDADNASDERAD